MKKKGIVCMLGAFFCLCLMRCDIYSTTHSTNIRYHFPEKTLISQIDENCLTEAGGESINKGNKLEKAFLAVLTEEIPVEKQKKVGDSLHQAISKNGKWIKDERYKRANRIFQRMKPFLAQKELAYQVFVVEASEMNAYTIPGGRIYLTSGLFSHLQSDDELALVLGHELGHNENQHTLRFLQRQQLAEKFFSQENAQLAANVFSVIASPYQQPQELEADRAALYLVYASGYSPEKALTFFERVKEEKQVSTIERFTSSHPFVNERIACMEMYLEQAKTLK
ncbi:MAG: M48 family metallopeptidase [Bacteroidia bacterium]